MLSKIQEITVFVVYDYNFTEFMPFNVFGEEFVAQMWLEVGRSRVGSWLEVCRSRMLVVDNYNIDFVSIINFKNQKPKVISIREMLFMTKQKWGGGSKTNNNYYRSKNKKLQCIRKTLLLSPECCFIKFCIVFVSFTKGPVSRLQLT